MITRSVNDVHTAKRLSNAFLFINRLLIDNLRTAIKNNDAKVVAEAYEKLHEKLIEYIAIAAGTANGIDDKTKLSVIACVLGGIQRELSKQP